MNKPILFLCFCFPFSLFLKQLQQSNDITNQEYVKQVQKTSYSEYIIIGFKLIITKIEKEK
jgi:hypothetical protein